MNCNVCNNEFKYIDGLKFCPYCGSKLNIQFVASNVDEQQIDDAAEDLVAMEVESVDEDIRNLPLEAEAETSENLRNKIHDTLDMPPVTDQDIRKDRRMRKALRRAQIIASIKSAITSKVVIIPCSALIVLAIAAFLGYKFLFVKYVDESQIRADLIGKVIMLPKGTKFEIDNGNIRNLVITTRSYNKEEGLERLDLNTTLNNNSMEVKGTIAVAYKKADKSGWKIWDKVELKENAVVKAVAGMTEETLAAELKKYNINVAGEELSLGDAKVKEIKVLERRPRFDEGKEEVIAEVTVDSGILSAKGNITGVLSFTDEKWKVETAQRVSETDFKTTLSSSLSEDIILEQIKKKSLEEQVAHNSVFGGKSFLVSDKFTKSMIIGEKTLDESSEKLNVSLKRENTAGVLKSMLAADYVFNVSLSGITLDSSGKSKVEAVSVITLTKEQIRNTLTGTEIEGKNEFFWWSDNHKIQESEAKTFELGEALSKKNYQNIKYVYGRITYKDGKKDKTVAVVALYYLVYDNSKGYVWKLDSVIGEESARYNNYSKAAIIE